MADPTTNNAAAVVTGSILNCVPKPVATDITDTATLYEIYDNLGYTTSPTKSWQWTTSSLTDCGITKQTEDANGVKYDYYEVFLNSASSNTATNSVQIAQMGQIKFKLVIN